MQWELTDEAWDAYLAAPFVAPRFGEAMVAPAWALSSILVVGGLTVLVAAGRGLPLPAVGWSAATMAVAMLLAVTFVYPVLDPAKSGRELAIVVRDATAEARAAGEPVLALALDNVSRAVNFYSGGVYLKDVDGEEELIAMLSSKRATFLLANKAALLPFPPDLRQRMRTVYSTRLSRKDLVLLRFDH